MGVGVGVAVGSGVGVAVGVGIGGAGVGVGVCDGVGDGIGVGVAVSDVAVGVTVGASCLSVQAIRPRVAAIRMVTPTVACFHAPIILPPRLLLAREVERCVLIN